MFKVGDKVRILRASDKDRQCSYFVSALDKARGLVGKVIEIDDERDYCKIELSEEISFSTRWNFPKTMLKLINDEKSMKTKLVKQDIKISNDVEAIKLLLEGYVIQWDEDKEILRLVNGSFKWTDGAYMELSDVGWEGYTVYEEEKVEWYEDIPEKGVLCWVSDVAAENKGSVNIVNRYERKLFITISDVCWLYATPLTPEEIKEYLTISEEFYE